MTLKSNNWQHGRELYVLVLKSLSAREDTGVGGGVRVGSAGRFLEGDT